MVPKKSTFSIVACDPETNDIAVCGTSHWFAYYRVVPFAKAGLGAIATQAECNLEYPEATFKLLADGASPKAVIEKIVGDDPNRDIRQVLVINKKGEVADW